MTASGHPSDAPTRPDLPSNVVAPQGRCRCGRTYEEHAELFPIDFGAACMGLRHNFQAADA